METLDVLITDDELGMRLGAERTLRNFTVHVGDVDTDVRFRIRLAESGEEALESIAECPPDILLLDHKMPGISGLEVMDRTRDLDGDMLTIMITAYASIETAITATKRGAYDFLAKPFTPDELKATVRKAAARIILAKQARKLADEKRQVRFQFIRVLGHELKAPLNAIEGYLNMLKDHALGDEVTAYDEMVGRSKIRIEGMRKLILDLLDMTRIESGQKSRELQVVDLREVTDMVIETNLAAAQDRNISIELDIADSVAMHADRGELEIIVNNLVSNAVKYNRDGGRVDVAIAREGDHVSIRVADTGIGMTSDEVARLFGEFVRIRNAKTANILGSGLGLSIIKKLAQLYDGEATVESTPDVGTTFTVRLRDQVPSDQKHQDSAGVGNEQKQPADEGGPVALTTGS